MEIYIKPNMSELAQQFNINLLYNDGAGVITETTLLSGITLPVDLIDYNSVDLTASTYHNSYYNNANLYSYANSMNTGTTYTTLNVKEDLFSNGDYIYVDNFYLQSGTTVTDYSGVYIATGVTSSTTGYSSLDITFDSNGLALISKPKINYYKGWKIDILRVSSSPTSTISDRYQITKQLL